MSDKLIVCNQEPNEKVSVPKVGEHPCTLASTYLYPQHLDPESLKGIPRIMMKELKRSALLAKKEAPCKAEFFIVKGTVGLIFLIILKSRGWGYLTREVTGAVA